MQLFSVHAERFVQINASHNAQLHISLNPFRFVIIILNHHNALNDLGRCLFVVMYI